MSSKRVTPVVLFALVSVACTPLANQQEPGSTRTQRKPVASEMLAKLPLSFVENRGQVPEGNIAHYINTPSTSIGFTPEGLRFSLTDTQGTAQRWGLALDFVGGRAQPVAEDLQEGVVSYFKGDPSEWKTNLPTHGRLIYRDLWPSIDLIYRSDGPRLKYELLVHPGGDPDDIRFRWRGATGVSLDPDGSLTASTQAGAITDWAPVSFQGDEDVATSYDLAGKTYGFRVGSYDRARTLVIDPAIFLYAGYIGGSADDAGFGIAVDAAGAAYVVGYAESTEATFPRGVGPDLSFNGVQDAFVAKVNAAGTALSYAGYIGGSLSDSAYAVAVDATGAAYVGGLTESSEATFPVTVGPDLTFNGSRDAFVAKVAPSGASLSYAGYIGGSGVENGYGVAVDGTGAAYVTGETESTEATFPDGDGFGTLPGPDLTYNGTFDAFVAKVTPSGASLSYAGYIGGSGLDSANAIAVDGAGSAYVTGRADSSEATFPVAVGPDLTFNGVRDAFVTKVAPSGSSLSFSGYIGGSASESGVGVDVDGAGSAYIAGATDSTEATFPVALGPDLTFNGVRDAFAAKVNAAGTALSYAGYIGGSDYDDAAFVAVDGAGAAYVTGEADSTEATFPVAVGPDLTFNGGLTDAYVAKVAPSGASLAYAGYIGGAGIDWGVGVAIDGVGAAYLTGYAASTEGTFPDGDGFGTLAGPDVTSNGMGDAFLAKVTDNLCLGKGVTIQGTAGADALTGTAGNDVILGLGGDDAIDGAGGSDTICAGDGNDVLIGGEGDDSLDGEAGSDTASFPGSTPVTADLLAGTASGASTDTLAGIENLIGSSGKDVLLGDGGPNLIYGGPGADRLSGRKGADRLAGQRGADNLLGGRGNDRLSGGRGRDRLSGGRGRDRCAGGKGTDTATGCEKLSGVP